MHPGTGMLESLFAPLFFVVLIAIVVGVAYVRRRTRSEGDARRNPGETAGNDWDARRRKSG